VDIPRKKKPNRARWVVALTIAAVIAVVSVALGRLREAPPSIDAATVTTGTVVRGPMQRDVRAPGTLVPLEIRWITAETSGRVDTIKLRAGAEVSPDTIVVQLSNPDTVLAKLQTERELASAEADLLQLTFRLQADKLTQENAVWSLKQEATDTERRAAAYEKGGEAVFTQLDILQMKDRAHALRQRVAIAERELAVLDQGMKVQIDAQKQQIVRRREMADFRKKQVEALSVRAGFDGVLQEMPLELGQWVVPGTVLAKVVKPEKLKAVLRVPETQAKDIALGQRVVVDTKNGTVPGHVARIATAATQGSVLVDVYLDGDTPAGARPDLNVDGTVEIEHLDSVLSLERPIGAQPDRPISLFRVGEGGREAVRVNVLIGRVSVNTVEVKSGLPEGARVIVSDMSRWETAQRLTLR
jgi:multidrug resistance efflux pump